jgi:hypothetical protein
MAACFGILVRALLAVALLGESYFGVGGPALPPPAAKFVPSSEPMKRPWNPPLLFSQSPCRSGRPSGSRGSVALGAAGDGA